MKKTFFPTIVLLIIAIASVTIYLSSKGKSKEADVGQNQTNETVELGQETNSGTEFKSGDSATVDKPIAILFYGDGCPHCAHVDEWIKANNADKKIKFDRLEVWYNQDNNKKLSEKAKACGWSADRVGVPFLYDIANNKCYSGSDKVIEYLQSKI